MKLTKTQEHEFERLKEKAVRKFHDKYSNIQEALKEAKKEGNKQAETELYTNMIKARRSVNKAAAMTPEQLYKMNKRAKTRRRFRIILILLILATLAYYYFLVR